MIHSARVICAAQCLSRVDSQQTGQTNCRTHEAKCDNYRSPVLGVLARNSICPREIGSRSDGSRSSSAAARICSKELCCCCLVQCNSANGLQTIREWVHRTGAAKGEAVSAVANRSISGLCSHSTHKGEITLL